MKYFSQSLKAFEEMGDQTGAARALGYIGIVYNSKQNYAKALEYFLKAKTINEGLNNNNAVQINLANIGIAYMQLRNYPEALKYHREALKISEEIKSPGSIAVNLGNIGAVYLTMATDSAGALPAAAKASALREAISHLERAINICREVNFPGPLVEFSQLLSDAYALTGDHKRSLATYKAYIALKDSLYSSESRSEIFNLETKREMALSEKDLLIKEKQIRINELEIGQQRSKRIILIISITLLSVLAAVSLKIFRRKTNKSTGSLS